MNKIIRIGNGPYGNIYCRIQYDDKRLSITGVEGPTRNGNARGSCGQIDRTIREQLLSITFAPGWDVALVTRFLDAWEHWHLNDMRAGCEHQRAEGWANRPLYPDQPTSAYVEHPDGSRGWNMLGWVRERDGGLLGKACPTCGYKYGTAWLHEDVPADVLQFLASLPDADQTPAWV